MISIFGVVEYAWKVAETVRKEHEDFKKAFFHMKEVVEHSNYIVTEARLRNSV